MKEKLIILFVLISHLSFSQCEDADKLDFGGTYMSKTNNYISFEEKYKDSIYLEDISYPEDIKKIEKYSNFILLKAEKYIVERGGSEFYKKLKMDHVEVNYKDSVKVSYEDSKVYNLSNYNVTNWILYLYKNKNIEYAFGLEFDKSGEMISENKFPKYSENNSFENLTDYCLALDLVKKDKRFKDKKVDYIELAYLESSNSFCWLIGEKKSMNKEFEKWEEKTVNLYFVNANTNKLELVKESKSYTIACGFGTLTKKTKKELRKEKRKRKREEKK